MSSMHRIHVICVLEVSRRRSSLISFFFFNDTATTEIYTLSLHDALPILYPRVGWPHGVTGWRPPEVLPSRSEEHTSELQSHLNLVCRLLLEKKKKPRSDHRAQGSRQSTDYRYDYASDIQDSHASVTL